jgi:hypothetical protein
VILFNGIRPVPDIPASNFSLMVLLSVRGSATTTSGNDE